MQADCNSHTSVVSYRIQGIPCASRHSNCSSLVPFQWFAPFLRFFTLLPHVLLLSFLLVLSMLAFGDGEVVPSFSSPELNEH